MIPFREFYLAEQDSTANPHSIKKNDKLELTIDGRAITFLVLDKQQKRGTKPTAGGGPGTGYYLDLEPVEDYGQGSDIANPTGASVNYAVGQRFNVPLDIIINKVNAGEGQIHFASGVADGSTQQQTGAGAGAGPGGGTQGYGAGQGRVDPDTDPWKGPGGAAQKYGHDVVSQHGMEKSAQSVLGARIGKWGDKMLHKAIGIPTKDATGPSVYAAGGPGGTAHGQRAKVGHSELDAQQDTRHPSQKGWANQ